MPHIQMKCNWQVKIWPAWLLITNYPKPLLVASGDCSRDTSVCISYEMGIVTCYVHPLDTACWCYWLTFLFNNRLKIFHITVHPQLFGSIKLNLSSVCVDHLIWQTTVVLIGYPFVHTDGAKSSAKPCFATTVVMLIVSCYVMSYLQVCIPTWSSCSDTSKCPHFFVFILYWTSMAEMSA